MLCEMWKFPSIRQMQCEEVAHGSIGVYNFSEISLTLTHQLAMEYTNWVEIILIDSSGT